MEYVLIIGHDIDFEAFNFKNKYVIGIDEGAYLALKRSEEHTSELQSQR